MPRKHVRHHVCALQPDREGPPRPRVPGRRIKRTVRLHHRARGEVQIAAPVRALPRNIPDQLRGLPDRAPVDAVIARDHDARVQTGGRERLREHVEDAGIVIVVDHRRPDARPELQSLRKLVDLLQEAQRLVRLHAADVLGERLRRDAHAVHLESRRTIRVGRRVQEPHRIRILRLVIGRVDADERGDGADFRAAVGRERAWRLWSERARLSAWVGYTMRPATIAFPLKDPLVGPLAAIAMGVLVARYVPFRSPELLAAMAAFAALAILSSWRGSRVLAAASCGLALLCGGALSMVKHAPAPAPRLDAEGREIVILGGCVVEPPAISGERERFLLELDSHARAQVTLYTKPGETLPALRYGQLIEADVRVRRPRNFGNPGAFDYATYLGRQEIYWTASGAAGGVRVPRRALRIALSKGCDGPAPASDPPHRRALSRRRLPGRNDAGNPDRPVLPTAKGLDGGVPLDRHLPCSRDLRDARSRARRLLSLLPAHLLRAGEHRDSARPFSPLGCMRW